VSNLLPKYHDFLPNASIDTLKERAEIIARVRAFFDDLGFFEVQTPSLSRDTMIDRHIDPLALQISLPGQQDPDLFFLQTSPEFAMKRLLAAGAQAIYQIGPAFRADESGSLHNVEFTMLEWYRVGDNYQAGMDLLDQLSQQILGRQPATRLTYLDAIRLSSGIDLNTAEGIQEFEQWKFSLNAPDFSQMLDERIEPKLRELKTVILYDWPSDQSALARIRHEHSGEYGSFAERFELYIDGIEVANGYHELTDPQEMLARNRQVDVARSNENKPRLPIESRLLDAMRAGVPDCSGVALGIDRLVMLALGKSNISDVMAFDIHRA